jgi:hypothetical protein
MEPARAKGLASVLEDEGPISSLLHALAQRREHRE